MAQTGYTPISIYYSATATNVPTAGNLVAGELAINTNDGVLYYKDSSGVVQSIASKAGNSGSFTNLAYTGTLTGGTGVVNLGSGQFYKDASGNVGIGTTTVANAGVQLGDGTGTGYKILRIVGANCDLFIGQVPAVRFGLTSGTFASVYNDANQALAMGTTTAYPLVFGTNNAERMRIDSSGNVGIGTSTSLGNGRLTIESNGGQMRIRNTTQRYRSDFSVGTNGLNINSYDDTGSVYTQVALTGNPLTFNISGSESMRIDSSGNLLVGTTSGGERLVVTAVQDCASFKNTGGTGKVYFLNSSASTIGSITWTGSTTTYATSSDYRLKENIAPMTGALATVSALKPVTYNWKVDGSSGQGFIAHELQAVVPDCVTGEKDAMRTEKYEISPAIPAEIDEDGKTIKEAVEAVMGEREVPAYQGIDTSFLVATLTAAIQELNAKVTALEAQLATK